MTLFADLQLGLVNWDCGLVKFSSLRSLTLLKSVAKSTFELFSNPEGMPHNPLL